MKVSRYLPLGRTLDTPLCFIEPNPWKYREKSSNQHPLKKLGHWSCHGKVYFGPLGFCKSLARIRLGDTYQTQGTKRRIYVSRMDMILTILLVKESPISLPPLYSQGTCVRSFDQLETMKNHDPLGLPRLFFRVSSLSD